MVHIELDQEPDGRWRAVAFVDRAIVWVTVELSAIGALSTARQAADSWLRGHA